MSNPYFVAHGVPSNAPSPSDNEVTSLQKINALLLIIANNGAGQTITQIYDPVLGQYRSISAPNGVITLGGPGT